MTTEHYQSQPAPGSQIPPSIEQQTAEMLERLKASLTTAKPVSASLNSKQQSERREKWVAEWLQMNLYHPQLTAMSGELHAFAQDVFNRRGSSDGRLIVLYGSNGCGKSHAAKSFSKWFNSARMKIGPVVMPAYADIPTETKIADCLYRSWPAVVDGFKQEQWLITDIMAAEYLTIIDDIGAEYDPSGLGIEKLYLILSRRECKHTIITTNFGPNDWDSKFERRIASRLFRNATHIDMSQVPDYGTK